MYVCMYVCMYMVAYTKSGRRDPKTYQIHCLLAREMLQCDLHLCREQDVLNKIEIKKTKQEKPNNKQIRL